MLYFHIHDPHLRLSGYAGMGNPRVIAESSDNLCTIRGKGATGKEGGPGE